MSGCTHDCSTCSSKCSKESLIAPTNKVSKIKHVIGVVSGKGCVGKSMVTSMLAVTMQRRGYQSAILDADITGPSIPRAFGVKGGTVEGSELGMFPPKTKTGIEIMSINLLVDEETKPVVWRGPVCRYASRNRRCAAYCISESAPRRNCRCYLSSGAGIHDC